MGKRSGRTSLTPATVEDVEMILAMRQRLEDIRIPLLQEHGSAHEYLHFSFLDGTGQNKNDPRLGPLTTIGHLANQLESNKAAEKSKIGVGYSPGIGSQSTAIARTVDGALAMTWRDGIEEAYRKISYNAARWIKADSAAQIRVVGVGYSRGAVQTVGLLRLIDQYGIADPYELSFGKDQHGNITVQSPHAPLVAPGQTLQATVLLDPVATGMPANYDARLPPSVISRVALMAAHERRTLFPHQAIVAETAELSPDQRAARLIAPGDHADVGGGNGRNGLEILTGNLVVDYLNQLRDVPLFEHRQTPDALSAYARHQAGGATAGFGLALDQDLQRDLRDALGNCIIVEPCRASEPIDPSLAAGVPTRAFQPDPTQHRQLLRLAGQLHEATLLETITPPAQMQDSQAIEAAAPSRVTEQMPLQTQPQTQGRGRHH